MGRAEKISRNLRGVAAAVQAGPDARRLAARRYFHDGLRRVVPYVGVESDGAVMFSSTRDRTIGRALFVDGWWDRAGLPAALARAGLDIAGRLMVEVGANIGTTTVQAARLGARVLAFEPAPMNYRLLRANVAVNLLDDRVTTINAGCSSFDGAGRLSLSDVNPGDHRVTADGAVPIELVRLDSALADHGVDPADVALLWMDTQGHEPDVLAGAPRLLNARPPILTEFWPPVLGDRIDSMAAAIAGYGTVVDMRAGAETTLDKAADRYRDGATDLLLLP